MITALLALAPDPAPSTTAGAACLDDKVCSWFDQVTGITWLAESSLYVVIKPLRVALIVILALVVRHLLIRTINRMINGAAEGRVPTMLRPLKERVPRAVTQSGTAIYPERRRQRAEAIGSVLRSITTVMVFTIAGLLVVGEFGVNLTPLIAGLGIFGAALGFGAQSLVKDLLAGLFMLLEDQYGVGDSIDVGEASGVVEAVGLRTVTVRDSRGVIWYVRNGEIIRVGNKSQGWAVVNVDIPVGFAGVEEVTRVLRGAAETFAADTDYHDDFLDPPHVVGVEEITVDGAIVRVTARTTTEAQPRVARELRRRLTDALESSGAADGMGGAKRGLRTARPPADEDTI
ncbi:small conductance mechanosensitive channel [Allocatelliglobosispora scoriae]|uniref:Small conductance mechanosensitive channel n=1 Tax=Allocatelliglobosispora scoriae TaxID=643052 RepID=A0A841BSH3_9ACTN|nr:mechanosensitive ion channel domain-containing protein [Allocatelliglobosispora scoriae]MBB5869863.1 small conductance mechanosensitive channel [Allocatelliglobosispora scoriae]